MPVEKLEYPAVLTKAAWNKNKGIAAKIFVGKTDVGASLAAVEKLFKEHGFSNIQPYAGLDPLEARAHWNEVFNKLDLAKKSILKALLDVRDKAGAARDVFATSKTASTASKTYLNNLVNAIEPFRKQVEAYPQRVRESLVQHYRERLKTEGELSYIMQITDWRPGIEGAKQTMEAIKKNPTLSNFTGTLHSSGGGKKGTPRAVTTWPSGWERRIALKLPLTASTLYPGKPLEDLAPLRHLFMTSNEEHGDASKYIREQMDKKSQSEKEAVLAFCNNYLKELEDPRMKTFLEALTDLRVLLTE